MPNMTNGRSGKGLHPIQTIGSAEDHAAAMEQLLELMEQNPLPGSAAYDEMQRLAILIETYEAANVAFLSKSSERNGEPRVIPSSG